MSEAGIAIKTQLFKHILVFFVTKLSDTKTKDFSCILILVFEIHKIVSVLFYLKSSFYSYFG